MRIYGFIDPQEMDYLVNLKLGEDLVTVKVGPIDYYSRNFLIKCQYYPLLQSRAQIRLPPIEVLYEWQHIQHSLQIIINFSHLRPHYYSFIVGVDEFFISERSVWLQFESIRKMSSSVVKYYSSLVTPANCFLIKLNISASKWL